MLLRIQKFESLDDDGNAFVVFKACGADQFGDAGFGGPVGLGVFGGQDITVFYPIGGGRDRQERSLRRDRLCECSSQQIFR